jgi:hypothetical protein
LTCTEISAGCAQGAYARRRAIAIDLTNVHPKFIGDHHSSELATGKSITINCYVKLRIHQSLVAPIVVIVIIFAELE